MPGAQTSARILSNTGACASSSSVVERYGYAGAAGFFGDWEVAFLVAELLTVVRLQTTVVMSDLCRDVCTV